MAMDTEQDHICIVDAGVAFKLPFPPLLRPQRNVDVFLAFEYSLRLTDYGPGIFEVLLNYFQDCTVLNIIAFTLA